MAGSHRSRVEALLADAAAEHASLLDRLPPDLSASLPVDAQGVTQAIDYLAAASGMSINERRALIRPTRSIRRCSTPGCSDGRRWRGRP